MTIKNKPLSKLSAFEEAFTTAINDTAQTLGLQVTPEQNRALLVYLDALILWGKAYNLTAILAPKEALIKHIFDCMAIVPDLPFFDKSDIRLLDIGTGAGLPSVIIAILKPDWHITALDSNQKKIRFIRQIASELGLKNIAPTACRIEEHHADFAGYYDVITSRAFASLTDFTSLAKPCLKSDGVLYAMKGKTPTEDELNEVQTLLAKNSNFDDKQAHDYQINVQKINVPNLSDDRCVVYIKSS